MSYSGNRRRDGTPRRLLQTNLSPGTHHALRRACAQLGISQAEGFRQAAVWWAGETLAYEGRRAAPDAEIHPRPYIHVTAMLPEPLYHRIELACATSGLGTVARFGRISVDRWLERPTIRPLDR